MTNGEKIKVLLKPREDQIKIYGDWVEIEMQKLGINFSCGLEWWNAEISTGSTTKNDLVVDWENYKDVDGNSLDDLILEVLQNNFDCGNTYGYKVADEIIELLPSVTPQPKTGHWIPIYQGDEIIDYRCSECEFGNTFGKGTIGMNFCPRCGSDNREVEE